MVKLVGHTLVDGTVGLDVNNVSNLVVYKVCRQLDGTLGPEVTREEVTGTGAKT